MNDIFSWSDLTQSIYTAPSLKFDPWSLEWEIDPEPAPSDLQRMGAVQALQRQHGRLRQVPIAVIGPREASAQEYQTAHALGAALAKLNVQLLCGGKNGVMEAAAKGNFEAGGRPIGLLPETDWRGANPYVAIPIATGIGKSRNAIIAQACPVLIAVGGGYGTMSEIAYGLHFDHLVLSLCDAPVIPGVRPCASVDEAIERTAEHLLRIPQKYVETEKAG